MNQRRVLPAGAATTTTTAGGAPPQPAPLAWLMQPVSSPSCTPPPPLSCTHHPDDRRRPHSFAVYLARSRISVSFHSSRVESHTAVRGWQIQPAPHDRTPAQHCAGPHATARTRRWEASSERRLRGAATQRLDLPALLGSGEGIKMLREVHCKTLTGPTEPRPTKYSAGCMC
jgi:hypothetical protein